MYQQVGDLYFRSDLSAKSRLEIFKALPLIFYIKDIYGMYLFWTYTTLNFLGLPTEASLDGKSNLDLAKMGQGLMALEVAQVYDLLEKRAIEAEGLISNKADVFGFLETKEHSITG